MKTNIRKENGLWQCRIYDATGVLVRWTAFKTKKEAAAFAEYYLS